MIDIKYPKCKHSWDRAYSYRYCHKCDRLQRLIFPGYDNLCDPDKWEDIGAPPFTKSIPIK